MGRVTAAEVVSDLLPILEIVPVEKDDLVRALALGLRDFEDGVQAACAAKAGADFIVTRDEKDFAGVAVPVTSPESAVRRL
jgi:predicted nucleic acid-binding protein